MADLKISQLPSASTPLAGTEVLPIVQGSATVKVSAANITAGRNVNVRTILATVADGSYPIGVSGTTKGVRVLTDANATSIQGVDSTLSGSYQPLAFGGLELRLQSNGTTDRWWLDSGGNLVQKTAAKGIDFTANTPAAGKTSQLLNWYEEGAYTSTITAQSGAYTSVSQNLQYTRIGRIVHVNGFITINTNGTAATYMKFTLPFNCQGSNYVSFSGRENIMNGSVFGGASISASTIALTKYDGTYLGGDGYNFPIDFSYVIA